MSDLLWCPECRHSRISEERSWLFVQRCERCGTELEDDAPPLEVDFREVDFGYNVEEEEEDDGEAERDEAKGDEADAQ
ncbi:hypothetical protein [Bradyrhizobium lupini]|uniref:hypothetical protein n=1 Tax=Rhizobium lupini TaxID=136996 RepID=UPI0034C62DE4